MHGMGVRGSVEHASNGQLEQVTNHSVDSLDILFTMAKL